MRKFYGLVIAVIAILFLGLAYSQLAQAEDPTCESVLAEQISALVKADQSKILDMQFELTALKLARESLKANETTVEAYIKKQEALIAKLDDTGVREKLRVLYQKNGEAPDAERVGTALQESVDKTKTANYFNEKTRFKNKDLSAYVFAHTLSGNATYNMNDVAILWLRSEISEGIEKKTRRGSAAANLQEVSTRVAQLTGVAGTKAKTPAEIDDLIAGMEQIIGEEMDRIAKTFTDDQKRACAEIATCATCSVTDEHKKAALSTALTSITQNLLQDQTAHDTAIQKVVDDLKTKGISLERDPEEVKVAKQKADDLNVVAAKGVVTQQGGSSGKDTSPGALKIGLSYNFAKTASRFKNCAGSISFTQVGSDLKLNFMITDQKYKTLCKGSYTVKSKDYSAWDDLAASTVCLKQDAAFVTMCAPYK